MASIKHLEAQARALIDDQKKLLDDPRPWSAKRKEYDSREADIKAVLELHKAQKSVDRSPFDGAPTGESDPLVERQLKGLHAGIASQGFRPMTAPQLELDPDQAKELQEAAASRKSLAIDVKATDSTSVPQSTITDFRTNPLLFLREPTRVLSLIPTFSTGSPSVTWYSTTGTAAAAAVAEGATKPTSSIAYSPNVGTVTKLAHVVEVTDETLADFPSFMGVLQQDMVAGLYKTENLELLTTTVTGAHKFPGLLNTTGILTAAVPATPTQTDRLDAISAAFDTLRVGASFVAEPSGIIMHPIDWGTIRRNKDSQNRYLLGDPGSTTDPRIWGVPVVLTSQMPQGTALIGDFANATAAYIREGIRVDVTNQGENQFKNNTTLVRAEERLLLTVPRPTGLLKLTGL